MFPGEKEMWGSREVRGKLKSTENYKSKVEKRTK
jgi:hypothetical protein